MTTSFSRLKVLCTLAAAVFAAGMIAPPRAQADDIEVFFSTNNEQSGKANVLFILDTSQSMYTVEDSAPKDRYVAANTYSGSCDPDKYYWAAGASAATPDCGAGWAGLTASQFNCTSWRTEVDAAEGGVPKTSRMAQLKPDPVPGVWVTLTAYPSQSAWKMACQVTGSVSPDAPANWSLKSKGKEVYPSGAVTFFKGNWLNWLAEGGGSKYRIDLVREAVGRIVTNTSGIRVGLMRYGYDGARDFKQNTSTACEVVPDPDEANRSSNGAPVVYPVTDLDGTAVTGFPGATVREQIRYQLGVDADSENLGWVVNPSLPDASQPYQIAKGGGGTCPIPLMVPGGRSPIGGAMREAFLYYSGLDWSQKFGKQADLGSTFDYPSVPQSRVNESEQYKSPIVDNCSKNFIVLLSDGTTEQDNDIDPEVRQLKDRADGEGLLKKYTGRTSCDDETFLTGTPPPSMCVDDLAEIMFDYDLNGTVPGTNNVITHTVGFKLGPNTDPASASARSLLTETASRGGGDFYEADSAQALESVLADIIRSILTENTSFSAPAVTVNSFNRTQNLNDLYMSVFRPAFNYRWQGNIKKYQIDPVDGDILDADGNPAVDPSSGYFLSGARSFWSGADDGADVTAGGASGLIEYGTRSMKTNPTTGTTAVELNSVAAGITATDLGIQTGDYVKAGVSSSGDLTVTNLLEWFYGKDIADEDGDGVTAESLHDMGDPLHAKPVTVTYGAIGSTVAERLNDDALFAVTNDGVLHAFDPDSTSGSELWAFVPRSLLGRVRELYYNAEKIQPEDRGYGLDGNIRVLRIDNDRDGIIEPTQWVDVNGDGAVDTDENIEYDRVYLYFGQRRGGSTYYAFDVTTKTSPKLLWERSYTAQGAGQSWSTPTLAKVRIDTTVHNVLIFGGGYDTTQDDLNYAEDTFGRGVYMVDALTGNLLWRAGPDSGADLQLTEMRHSIPGDVRVIDLTGDGYADRMYAADLGGRIWRFDIFNGKNSAGGTEGNRLVEGGMVASLGNVEQSAPRTESNTIRFFNAPDPALITQPGPTFINIAIGSGHRELPATDKTVVNWMFSVRDYNVLSPLLSSWYKADCSGSTTACHEIVQEGDLVDLTSIVGASATAAVPAGSSGAAGWKIQLEETGEKVLAEARTFQNNVFFTTYAPVTTGLTSDSCGITFGLNQLYVVRAFDARPTYDRNLEVDGELPDDRSNDLASKGTIAPEVVFVFPTPPDTNGNGPNPAVPPICLVGLEKCGFGITNPPVRTYWRQRGANQ